MVLAVKAGAVATPDALVVAVAVLVPVELNVPLAPVDGAVNVATAPGTAFPYASRSFAARAVENAVETDAIWLAPAVIVTVEREPARFASEKVAGWAPCALADTVYDPATLLAL
jgi:hypothetical protein